MEKELQKLNESIYYLPHNNHADRPTLGVVSGAHASLIIDAGNSYAHAKLFNDQLTRLYLPPTKAVVNTHWHWDHWFGNAFYSVPIVANKYTASKIAEQAKLLWNNKALDERVRSGQEIEFCSVHIKEEFPNPERILDFRIPDGIIDESTEIDLGGLTCILESVDTDHCLQNMLVFIPERRTLFIGDALYFNLYAEKWHYTKDKLEPFLKKVASFDADYIVPSHSNVLSKKEYLAYFAKLKSIQNCVYTLGNNFEEISKRLKTEKFYRDEDTQELVEAFMAGL